MPRRPLHDPPPAPRLHATCGARPSSSPASSSYGFLNFWNTAQSELWYSTLGVAGRWAIERVTGERRAQILSGAFAALSVITKPPGVWFVLLAVVLMALRVRETSAPLIARLWKALLFFSAGFGAHERGINREIVWRTAIRIGTCSIGAKERPAPALRR